MASEAESRVLQAREFYRERLAEAFRLSRQFSQPLGSVAEQVMDSPAAEGVLRECPLGSLDAARRLGEMAVIQLDRVAAAGPWATGAPSGAIRKPGPWWRDLLNYERGWFLQLATTAEPPPTNRPRRGVSALCMNFTWRVPALVEQLQSGKEISDDLHRPVTLLFARTREGRVAVVEVGVAVEKVFRATNGLRTVDQIADVADVPPEDTRRILESLGGIGAVVLAMSPEEMTRIIEQRERQKDG